MTEDQLTNLLFKISVEAICRLCDGDTDPISVQESIEVNTYSRPIVSCVQIFKINNISDSEKEITFILSTDFLIANSSINTEGTLSELMWIFKLPTYDSGTIDDESGNVELTSEEGVVEWLTRGSVGIVKVNNSIYKLSTSDLIDSLIRFERD